MLVEAMSSEPREGVDGGVYPPSEDTFLLLDCLEEGEGLALELGCGSGVVALQLAKHGWWVVATDINEEAVRETRKLLEREGMGRRVSLVVGDLLSPFRDGVGFDLLVFNAPYVPHDEPPASTSDLAWHGGKTGRRWIDRLIDDISTRGLRVKKIFLVQSAASEPSETRRKLHSMGYDTRIVGSKSDFFDEIVAIKAVRPV